MRERISATIEKNRMGWDRFERSLRTKATISFGQEISVSAVQVLQAATALANGGLLLAPRIVARILSPGGELVKEFGREPVREVLSPQVARQVLEMMAAATGLPVVLPPRPQLIGAYGAALVALEA